MSGSFQITIEALAGSFFLVVAIACLLWPRKFYEHALRPRYRKPDRSDEPQQNLQRSGYIWTVRIIGVIAAIMFASVVIHLLSSRPPKGARQPVPVVPKQVE